MLSVKPPWPPNSPPQKAAPPPVETGFVGHLQEFIAIWLPALFPSHPALCATRDDPHRDGCDGVAMGTGARVWGGEGRRIRGEASTPQLCFMTGAAGLPLGTAGLLPGCCRAALWLMRHLLRLTVCICRRSPPPAKLPAAAARRLRSLSQPGGSGRSHLHCPGHPRGRSRACDGAG